MDQNALEYLSGYIYKRLIGFHKKECDICKVHGARISKDTTEITQDQIFTCLKRYADTNAKMWATSLHFRDFVRHVLQIAAYCFQQNLEEEGLVQKVVLSVQQHLSNFPTFCDDMLPRVIALIARTKITNMMKLRNSELKGMRKAKKRERKYDPGQAKFAKLSHE